MPGTRSESIKLEVCSPKEMVTHSRVHAPGASRTLDYESWWNRPAAVINAASGGQYHFPNGSRTGEVVEKARSPEKTDKLKAEAVKLLEVEENTVEPALSRMITSGSLVLDSSALSVDQRGETFRSRMSGSAGV